MHGIQPFSAGRLRDVEPINVDYGDDEPTTNGIHVRFHTRNGSGNKEFYEDEIESLQSHPWFVASYECDYDQTYMNFLFKPSDEYLIEISQMSDGILVNK